MTRTLGWACFQNCWHINDWIRNDENLPKTVRDAVWEDVNKNDALLLAADLANGTKHFNRNPKRERSGADFSSVIVNDSDDGAWIFVHEVTFLDGTKRPVLGVAEDAMNAWSEILSRHRMYSFIPDVA
jgi:hypothetical protein